MAVPLLDLKAQHASVRDEVVREMMQVVDDQAFILGKPVSDLEADVARLSKTKYAIGCASGTDALLLALKALDIGAGGEVVTTPIATGFAPLEKLGAKRLKKANGGIRTTKATAFCRVEVVKKPGLPGSAVWTAVSVMVSPVQAAALARCVASVMISSWLAVLSTPNIL